MEPLIGTMDKIFVKQNKNTYLPYVFYGLYYIWHIRLL